MKATSKATKASETRRGIKPTSFKFSPDELALLDEIAEIEGGRKAAVVAALRKYLQQGKLTKAQLLEEIERRLK